MKSSNIPYIQAFRETTGSAAEYAPTSVNFAVNCGNECEYCFQKKILKRFGVDQSSVRLREGFFEAMERQAPNLAQSRMPVMVSFATDSFCRENIESGATYKCLEILLKHRIPTAILTKGTIPIKYFHLIKKFGKHVAVGVSLTYRTAAETSEHELGTAYPDARIRLLKRLNKAGIKTFVSFEPMISAKNVIEFTKKTAHFTDLYLLGTMTQHKNSPKFSADQIKTMISDFMMHRQYTSFYIKNSIREIVPDMQFVGSCGNAKLTVESFKKRDRHHG